MCKPKSLSAKGRLGWSYKHTCLPRFGINGYTTAHFYKLSYIIEGSTEKVLQWKMPMKSMYKNNDLF